MTTMGTILRLLTIAVIGGWATSMLIGLLFLLAIMARAVSS